jgi:hypothetical protein
MIERRRNRSTKGSFSLDNLFGRDEHLEKRKIGFDLNSALMSGFRRIENSRRVRLLTLDGRRPRTAIGVESEDDDANDAQYPNARAPCGL